jgi:F-type H+-transporting ATPase subunit epsilon
MAEALGKFNLTILDPDRKIFEGQATNLFIQGDTGEFELMPFHYPVLSLLREGHVIIDWKHSVSVKSGIIRFFKNECVVIVELKD